MKKVLLFVTFIVTFTVLKGQESSNNYVEFIKKQNYSSKDYILNLFEKYDIVIICERAHPEKTQYDLFMNIIQDEKFVNQVGNICTEVGLSSLNEEIDKFLTKKFKSTSTRYESVLKISRNLSFHPIWEKYNYTDFLLKLNLLNSELSANKKIRLKTVDVNFRWNNIKNLDDYKTAERTKINKRDSIMADNILTYYESIKNEKRHKILVILNYRHAFGDIMYLDGSKPDNAARYIFEKYPNRTANVLLNTINVDESSGFEFKRVAKGEWDKAFYQTNISSIGFNFKDSPFGKDSFDMFPYQEHNLLFQDVFTGFCYYLPIEKHLLLVGVDSIFNNDFIEEYLRRISILGKSKENEKKNIIKLNKTDTLTYFDFDKNLITIGNELHK